MSPTSNLNVPDFVYLTSIGALVVLGAVSQNSLDCVCELTESRSNDHNVHLRKCRIHSYHFVLHWRVSMTV